MTAVVRYRIGRTTPVESISGLNQSSSETLVAKIV